MGIARPQPVSPHELTARTAAVRQAGRTLLLCCFAYMIAFMWMQFLSAWVVQHITESTRLVQLTGFFQIGAFSIGREIIFKDVSHVPWAF